MPETRSSESPPRSIHSAPCSSSNSGQRTRAAIEGRARDWPLGRSVVAGSAVLGLLFVLAERRIERRGGVPLVPLSLFAVPGMRRGLLVAVLFFTGFGGFMFTYPLGLQNAARLSPMQAGGALATLAIGFLIASLTSAQLVARCGRRVIAAGLLLGIMGLAMLGDRAGQPLAGRSNRCYWFQACWSPVWAGGWR